MRTLLRLVVVWLLVLPLAGYFGFPYLTAYLQSKAQGEAYTQCLQQTAAQPAAFDPSNPAIAEQYCQCLRDGVTVTRDDVKALLRRQPAPGIQQRVEAQVDTCTDRMQNPAAGDAQTVHF